MKKFLNATLLLGSISSVAASANVPSLPEVCRFKCNSEVIYGKYVNGEVKENRPYGEINLFYYSKDSNIEPGTYLSSDSRIGKSVREDLQVCGVYINLLTQNGDFIERLIPNTVYTNRAVTNGVKYLGGKYTVDDWENTERFYGLLDKKPIYITNEQFETNKMKGLEKLKDDGVCR